jgi:hypothetical protein
VNASSLDPAPKARPGETALTPARLLTPDELGLGLGLGTRVQAFPFQRKIRVIWPQPR